MIIHDYIKKFLHVQDDVFNEIENIHDAHEEFLTDFWDRDFLNSPSLIVLPQESAASSLLQ